MRYSVQPQFFCTAVQSSAMDELSLEDKISVLKELEEATKCPLCLNILCPPLCWCQNGHCICAACKGDRLACQTCTSNFIQINTTLLAFNNVINIVPRNCKYLASGCNRFMVPLALKDHEYLCSFREVSCLFSKCFWKGKVNCMIFHIKTEHPSHKIFPKESSIFVHQVKTDVDGYKVRVVEAFDCIFWIHLKIDVKKGKLLVFFVCVPTADGVDTNFYSVIIFNNDKSIVKYQYTQKVYKEDVDTESILSYEKCMTIPLSELSHFITDKKSLLYNFKIVPETEISATEIKNSIDI